MRKNPFDKQVDNLVGAMKGAEKGMDKFSENVRPFDSVKLSDQEEAQLYDYPTDFFPGTPLTIQEARLDLVEKLGPIEYTRWVMKMEGRRRVAV